jgi:hypothetical protein
MRVPLKHKPGEHAAVHRPARSWHRGPDPDAPISFADIAELPDPDWIGRSQQGPSEEEAAQERRDAEYVALLHAADACRVYFRAQNAVLDVIETTVAELAALAPIATAKAEVSS